MTRAVFWDREHGATPVVCGVNAINGLAFNSHQSWAFRRADMRAIHESPFRLPDGELASMAHIRAMPREEYGAARLLSILGHTLGTWPAWLAGRVSVDRLAVALALPERHGEHAVHERFRRERAQLEIGLRRLLVEARIEPRLELHAYGHAGPAYSMRWAGELIAAGQADVVLVLGVDSYYDPEVVDALAEGGRVFDGRRAEGFIPGEGGALVVLAGKTFARTNQWSIQAELVAASIGHENASLHGGPNLGAGLTETVCALSDELVARQETVDWWLGDVSTESVRVREFQLAFPRFSARVAHRRSTMELLPSHFGDLGAATIPTGVAIAIEGFSRGDPSARNCLLWAASDGPSRGAVLLRNPRRGAHA